MKILSNILTSQDLHCLKNVCIASYSGPYPVKMRKNTDQNNSEYEVFSRSAVSGQNFLQG